MLVHDIQPNNPWSLYKIMEYMPVNAKKERYGEYRLFLFQYISG